MLLEESPQSGYNSARQHLTRIRETARELTRFIQTKFVPQPGRAEKAYSGLRYDLAAPLHTILQAVGAITSESTEPPADDVMKIGRAAAELLGLVHARTPGDDVEVPAVKHVAAPKTRGRRKDATAAKKRSPEIEPGRILIVDDNRTNRDLLVRRLKRQGHHVTEAASGAQALQLMLETEQDVVLLDVLMPKLDGFQVLEKMKADPALARIPVIVVSALNEGPGAVRCVEMGAEDYLLKPIDSVLLSARIGSSLEKKRLRDAERRISADLERANQDLQLSEERLRLALKAGAATLWEWDLASNRILVPEARNGNRERGLEALLESIHAEDRERVRARLYQAVQQGREFHEEMRILRADGSFAWVESFGTIHVDEFERPERMIGLTRNIKTPTRAERNSIRPGVNYGPPVRNRPVAR